VKERSVLTRTGDRKDIWPANVPLIPECSVPEYVEWRKTEEEPVNPGSSGKRPLTTDMVVKIMSTGTVESQGSKCQPNVLLCSMQNYARRQLFCSGTPWETCV